MMCCQFKTRGGTFFTPRRIFPLRILWRRATCATLVEFVANALGEEGATRLASVRQTRVLRDLSALPSNSCLKSDTFLVYTIKAPWFIPRLSKVLEGNRSVRNYVRDG